MLPLYILFSLFFLLITWHRFSHGVFLLFLLLPTYLLRFSIGPLPVTLLEIMIWIVCIIGVAKHARHIEESVVTLFRKHAVFTIGTILFLLGATISLFTAVDLREAAGAWKAFYIEPFILFLVLYFARESLIPTSDIVLPLLLSGLGTSLLAIYQHFTGWMVPWAFWENGASFRVTAWYGFPNGVGLFLAPLVPLALYEVFQHWFSAREDDWGVGRFGRWIVGIVSLLVLICAPVAVFFAKSTGGLIGILAGFGVFLLYYKKTRWPTVGMCVVALLALVTLPALASIRTEVFLGDRSGQIRVAIWKETITFLKDRPLLGAGLSSYDERIAPYHTLVNGEGIEIFHHPHNIFLTMWVNLGLLGLIGFITILVGLYTKGLRSAPTLVAVITVILVTGLVDSPYIKNDLAVLFWVIPFLLLTGQESLS